MRFAFPRLSRPPIGTPLDASSQLQRGLIYFAPFWGEGNGKLIRDIVQRNDAGTVTGSPVWASGLAGSSLSGINCTNASIKSGTIPAGQQSQLVWPMTIAFGATITAEQSTVGLFSLYSGSANIIAITGSTTSGLTFSYLNGSSSVAHATVNNNITLGTNVVASLTITPTIQNLYINGNLAVTSSNAASNPTLGSPVWFIGGGASANAIYYWAAAWNRVLSSDEHVAVARNIWQIFMPIYPAGILGGQPYGALLLPIQRPICDRTGSRRLIWAE